MDASFAELALRTVGALAVVSGLIFLASWLARLAGGGSGGSGWRGNTGARARAGAGAGAAGGGSRLRLIQRLRPSIDTSIYLIEADGVAMLVASGKAGVAIARVGEADAQAVAAPGDSPGDAARGAAKGDGC